MWLKFLKKEKMDIHKRFTPVSRVHACKEITQNQNS